MNPLKILLWCSSEVDIQCHVYNNKEQCKSKKKLYSKKKFSTISIKRSCHQAFQETSTAGMKGKNTYNYRERALKRLAWKLDNMHLSDSQILLILQEMKHWQSYSCQAFAKKLKQVYNEVAQSSMDN